MKRQSIQITTETVIVALLSVALYFVPNQLSDVHVFWSGLPIGLFALRRGLKPAIAASVLAAAGVGAYQWFQYQSVQTDELLTFVAYPLPGFFTRNIHRTLNNRRISSVWLNVVTSAVGMRLLILMLVLAVQGDTFNMLGGILFVAVYIALAMLIAYTQPKLILTKKSPHLSSKERSKLLND